MLSHFDKKHYCTHLKSWDLMGSVLGQYFIDGIEKGENVQYYTDRFTDKNLLSSLDLSEDQHGQILEATKKGQFKIYSAEQVYLTNGYFNMLERLGDIDVLVEATRREGYQGLRIAAEMDWIEKAKNSDITDLVIEYETRCNNFFKENYITCMCIYCEESASSNLCFGNLHSHPHTYKISSLENKVLVNPLMSQNSNPESHLEDLKNWIKNLRSMGLKWMSKVDRIRKDQFKNKIQEELSQYIRGEEFSHKEIPDLFLKVSELVEP